MTLKELQAEVIRLALQDKTLSKDAREVLEKHQDPEAAQQFTRRLTDSVVAEKPEDAYEKKFTTDWSKISDGEPK